MIIWINGAFGAGKTTTAIELNHRIENSFIYDPENVGYFIRENTPKDFSKGDFQDISTWREINYFMLKMLIDGGSDTIIVPMTLVNPAYFNEIVTRLQDDSIVVKHYILYASKETLKRNLLNRSNGDSEKEKFAFDAIERCVFSYDNHIKDTKILVDEKSVDEIVDEILEKSGLV